MNEGSQEQAKDQEHEKADENEKDIGDSTSVKTASSTPRKRRWFGGKESKKSPAPSPATSAPSSTSLNVVATDRPSRPVSMLHSRAASYGGGSYSSSPRPSSASSSIRRGRGGRDRDNDSIKSIRDREIEEAQDRLDRWGARATEGTERAEREFGLGDEVNMGLS